MKERLSYDPFVLPFTIGFIYILIFLTIATLRVVKSLPFKDRKKLGYHLFSWKIFISIKEIFLECLIHKKIWKRNPWLGYMHMSIAFGWFMLILLAHIEVKLFCPYRWNLPYYPIFFRYFVMETESTLRGSLLFFLMDFFLLITLSGIFLALYKRFRPKRFSMRRTTRLKLGDTIAMYTLWLIFPLRLLAESFTSGVAGGSFLTRGMGILFENFISDTSHILPTWWAYSCALGVFFVALPHSRYMHIPTEILLIVMRNAGIKVGVKNTGYAKVAIYSCSRCGICIDPCQMASAAQLHRKASVYFIRQFRHHDDNHANMAAACLMCGRCVDACPVGIDSCALKQNVRNAGNHFTQENQYQYLPAADSSKKADVLYFAGCMTHLTQDIKKAMLTLLDSAKVNYHFMDEDGSICCGRPLSLAGQQSAADILIQKNKEIIEQSGAKILVTSCPICYRVFNEVYNLKIQVLHHTEYLNRLLQENKLRLKKSNQSVVFHDSCELARYSSIYEAPRKILSQAAHLQATPFDGENALCCGGSLGSLNLNARQRRKIAVDAAGKLTQSHPDCLVTACPLCKKTFAHASQHPVKDIAQIMAENLV